MCASVVVMCTLILKLAIPWYGFMSERPGQALSERSQKSCITDCGSAKDLLVPYSAGGVWVCWPSQHGGHVTTQLHIILLLHCCSFHRCEFCSQPLSSCPPESDCFRAPIHRCSQPRGGVADPFLLPADLCEL
jgi:hypothetical protein